MNKVEIETITEAILQRHKRTRNGVQEFLKTWAKITQVEVPGFLYLPICHINDCEIVYLERSYGELYFTQIGNRLGEEERLLEVADMDIEKLRDIMEALPERVVKYFRRMQKEIDLFSDAAQQLSTLTLRLEGCEGRQGYDR